MKPRVIGIGIGPGDPDLITVKGRNVLQRCAAVVVPSADADAPSLALRIARTHIPADTPVHSLVFPMTRDDGVLRDHWRRAADTVASLAEAAGDVAFLSLGDVGLYSTFGYLRAALRTWHPRVEVQAVPGVPAFCAAAAAAGISVAEGGQPVTIWPAARDLEGIAACLRRGTAVIMKIGRHFEAVRALLRAHKGRSHLLAARVGLPEEHVTWGIDAVDPATRPGYLSLIISKEDTP